MRPGPSLRLALERAAAPLPLEAVWRRRGLGRPVAAILVLALIGGAVTMAHSLLDLPEAGFGGGQGGWPTAAAGGLRVDEVGPALALPPRGEALPAGELEALLAGLKEGAFGVAFEAVLFVQQDGDRQDGERKAIDPRAIDPTSPEAEGAFAPVVLVDAERPPLRIDIMGLSATRRGGRVPGDAGPAP
jgi:hypothetical protein